MVRQKSCLQYLHQAVILAVLTFIVPVINWLAGELPATSPYSGLTTSMVVTLSAISWHRRTKALIFLSPVFYWNAFSLLGGIVVLVLMIINIHNAPVANITGLPRSPSQVIDVIIFLVIAEELIFRGVIWSLFEKFSRADNWIVPLLGRSLLFGLMHFGYWAQSDWIFQPAGVFHVISIVFAGAFLGAIRLISRSLAVPVVIHMLANGIILLTQ